MLLRLAFAASTATDPDIVLMDELIGVGDARFQHKANELMRELMQTAKILVVSSHDEYVLKNYCNTAIVLKNGEIAMRGDIDEAIAAYRDLEGLPPLRLNCAPSARGIIAVMLQCPDLTICQVKQALRSIHLFISRP